MNDTMKGGSVGTTASSLKLDVIRRLKTVALASEAPDSAAHGLLAGLNKYEALIAGIGTREGFRKILEALEPLSHAVVLAKRAIRNREGLVITQAMLEGLRNIIAWHARCCGAALEGNVYQDEENTELGMLKKQIFLTSMMDHGATHCPASSPARSSRTASTSSRSRASSSISSALSLASSNACKFSEPTQQGVVLVDACVELDSPGAEVVVPRQSLTMVGLLVARLPGGTAMRRWCARAISVCITRARLWV